MKLTNATIEEFNNNGFLAVPDFIDEDTLQALTLEYDRLLSKRSEGDDDRMLGGLTRQYMFPEKYSYLFSNNLALELGKQITGQLRGWKDVAFFYSQLLFKPPHHPYETPWHQDDAYGDMPFAPAGSPLTHQSLQFWLAIDPADETNGCMHFHPPVDKERLLPHIVTSGNEHDDGRLLGLENPDRYIDEASVVACRLPAGGVSIHDPATLHYTPENKSDRPRRAYIFNFADAELVERVFGSSQ